MHNPDSFDPAEMSELLHRPTYEPMTLCIVTRRPLIQTMGGILERFVASLPEADAFCAQHARELYTLLDVDVARVCPPSNQLCQLDVLTVGGQVIPSLPPARHEWELVRHDWVCSQCSRRYRYTDDQQAPRCCLCGRCSWPRRKMCSCTTLALATTARIPPIPIQPMLQATFSLRCSR